MKRFVLTMCLLAGCGRVQVENEGRGGRPAQVVSAGGRVTGGGLVVDVQLGASFVSRR